MKIISKSVFASHCPCKLPRVGLLVGEGVGSVNVLAEGAREGAMVGIIILDEPNSEQINAPIESDKSSTAIIGFDAGLGVGPVVGTS